MARKLKRYHYIYKITNILNDKFYIGMHSTNNLEDGYFGSGTRLWYSLNKHGKDNHTKEILEYLPDRKSLKEREKAIVDIELINEVLCMNVQLGGGGGFIDKNHQLKCSSAGGKANAERLKTDPEHLKKFQKIGSNNIAEYIKSGNIIPSFGMLGKAHSEDTKIKMSEAQSGKGNSQYGTCWIYNLELKKSKKIKKEELNIWLNENWLQGRKLLFK